MKHIYIVFVSMFLFACSDDDTQFEVVTVATPITQLKADLRAEVDVVQAAPIEESGKFYFYQDYIFVNDNLQGVHVIDNRIPEAPQKIAFIKIPGNKDVEVKNNILYADSFSDLVLFDISDINNIQFLDRYLDVLGSSNYEIPEIDQVVSGVDYENFDSTTQIIIGWEYKEVRRPVLDYVLTSSDDAGVPEAGGQGGSFARFKIVNDHLYIIDSSSLYTFNISTGDQPQLLNTDYIEWNIETIFNQDDYLYLGSTSGMFIYDVSEADAPAYVSSISHLTGCDPVVVQGDYAYLTLRGGNVCGQDLSLLEVIDVTDKSNPFIVKDFTMIEPYGLGVHNDKLYVSDGPNGLHIYDRSDPVNLELLTIIGDIEIYDVIPLPDKLLMIGGEVLYQYHYDDAQLQLISSYTLN